MQNAYAKLKRIQPRLVVEALAVYGLDLGAQYPPLGGRVRAEFGLAYDARLPPAHVAGLYEVVLGGLHLAYEV